MVIFIVDLMLYNTKIFKEKKRIFWVLFIDLPLRFHSNHFEQLHWFGVHMEVAMANFRHHGQHNDIGYLYTVDGTMGYYIGYFDMGCSMQLVQLVHFVAQHLWALKCTVYCDVEIDHDQPLLHSSIPRPCSLFSSDWFYMSTKFHFLI